jgi:hypothetical protein
MNAFWLGKIPLNGTPSFNPVDTVESEARMMIIVNVAEE